VSYNAGAAQATYTLDISATKRAAEELRRIFKGIKDDAARASAPSSSGSGATPLKQQSDAALKAALSQQKLATETQRTAAAQNTAARAAQALATEENKTAREAANTAAAQDRAAKSALQLAAAQQRAAKANQNGGNGPALPRTFAGFTPGGLAQAAGAVGLATSIPQVIAFGIESGKASLALDRQLRLTKELAGTQATYNQVIAAAKTQQQLYGGSLQENIAGIQGLLVTSRSTGAELQTLINLSQRLAVLDPAQGAEGARIALSEVLSGDPRSLARRYEIPLAALEKIKDESQPVAARLAILDQYLNKIGITSATVNSVVSEQAKIYNDLGTAADAAKVAVGGLFAAQGTAGAAGATSALTGITQLVTAYQRLTENSGQAGQVVSAIVNPIGAYNNYVLRAGASTLEWIGGLVGVKDQVQQAAQGTAAYNTAVLAATTTTRAGTIVLAEENKEKLTSTIATAQLAQQQAQLDADSQRAAIGLLGAGDQALLLAKKYGIAVTQAQFLINAQQALSNATALADQRVGERDPGNTQTAKQFNDFSKLARAGAAEAAAERKRAADKAKAEADQLRDAQNSLNLARATTKEQKIAELLRQQKATADPVEKLRLQAQIEQERKSGAGRVGAAQSTALQLQNTEENAQLQLLRTQREGLERLRDQQEDFDVRRVRSKEDLDRKVRGLLARGQVAEARRAQEEFALDQKREQEDFDRGKRRTLRNNAEGLGDIGARTDLRQEQIGNRAALRGVRTGGGASLGGGTAPASLEGAGGVSGGAGRVISITFPSAIFAPDGQKLGDITYPFIAQRLDDDLAIEIRSATPPGGNQTAIAGARP